MGKRWAKAILAAALMALATSAHAAAPDAALLAESCGACHGTGGVSAGPSIPSLAGQPKAYFVTAMRRFKSGERPSTVMGRLAKGYSDAEIDAMGAYFAARKAAPQAGPVDAALAKRGIQIYFKQCRTCHLDGGLWKQIHHYQAYEKSCSAKCHLDYGPESDDEVPLIGGQWVKYLEMQIDDFRSGRRPMSKRKAKFLNALSQDDVGAVANFYAGLKDLER